MTFAVLVLKDDAFDDEPFVVLGVNEDHVAGLAAAYLRAASPAVHTGRLVVPDQHSGKGWYDWLMNMLADVEDIEVTIYSTDKGELMPAGVFSDWIAEHAGDLHRQHTPHVVDVVKDL